MILTKDRSRPKARIDTSALPHGQQPRFRSSHHLKWIRKQRCCIPGCGRTPCSAHHLTCSPNAKGRGLRAGDNWTLPLCEGFDGAGHHQGQDSPHHAGDERAWWAKHGVDPIATAAEFWRRSPASKGKQ